MPLTVEKSSKAPLGTNYQVNATVQPVSSTAGQSFVSYGALGLHGAADYVSATLSGVAAEAVAVNLTTSGIWLVAADTPTSPGRAYLTAVGR